jgi:hypothetical protein
MILAYGSFKHPLGQPKVSFVADAIKNDGEVVVGYTARVDIAGMIIGSGNNPQQSIDQQIQQIKTAYSVPNQDVVLYLSDGVTASQNVIRVQDTLGGIRVVRAPSFPEGGGAEYATYRTFTVGLEAELPAVGPSALWSFRESLAFQGGGRIWDIAQPIYGDGIEQTIKQNSPYSAVQTGEAVGYRGYWAKMWPGPLWPPREQGFLREESMEGPRRIGTAYKLFPTRWTYRFKSVKPLKGTATPNLWPLAN